MQEINPVNSQIKEMDRSQKTKYKQSINLEKNQFLNHQKNINQNYIEIISHPSQDSYYQENK